MGVEDGVIARIVTCDVYYISWKVMVAMESFFLRVIHRSLLLELVAHCVKSSWWKKNLI